MCGSRQLPFRRRGEPPAEPDLRIAATTVLRGLTLVTRSGERLGPGAGLAVENWIDDG